MPMRRTGADGRDYDRWRWRALEYGAWALLFRRARTGFNMLVAVRVDVTLITIMVEFVVVAVSMRGMPAVAMVLALKVDVRMLATGVRMHHHRGARHQGEGEQQKQQRTKCTACMLQYPDEPPSHHRAESVNVTAIDQNAGASFKTVRSPVGTASGLRWIQ